jgi:hypothetical protein
MLKTIDILIGLAVVMLLMSMIVTVLTQFFNSLLNTRGKHLWQGIADILQQISPGIERHIGEEISGAVLSHPLIRNVKGRFGGVIHREELTKLLLELASGSSPQKISGEALTALQNMLVATGVCSSGSSEKIQQQLRTVIRNIGEHALQLELAHPELTNSARARIAILQQAGSGFVAKINLWFDQTIDRISERFTYHTRFVTFGAGLLLALIVQLDTAALVSRLGSDDVLRASMVAEAQSVSANPNSVPALNATELQNIHDLQTNNLIGVPVSFSDWAHRWSKDNAPMKLLGILLSSILLSLGAPFWYNALQNLLRLRSLVAVKDDIQRTARQLPLPAAAATAVASVASGERSIAGEERSIVNIVNDERGELPRG